MKPMLKFASLVPVLVFCACASGGFVPARGYLVRDHQPRGTAYGYLIFTKRPSAEEAEKYRAVCNSYLESFPPAGEYNNLDPNSVMITYWLLSRPPVGGHLRDCAWLIENYDYARANQIASSVDKNGASGPILIASSSGIGHSGPTELVLDISRFSNEDMDRAFRIWKAHISRRPEVWQSGFQVTVIREAFRNFIQTYGETIVGFITD